ncbi:Glucanase OS=Streptomyces fumanus OX=67302 GN=GCM10018772_58800 PE=3 SV=1 [Streptomyces fumanus]
MSRTRTALLAALALVAGATGTAVAVVPGDVGAAAVPCTVDYKVQNQWDTGFTAAVTITNNSAAKTSWSLKWSYAGNQKVVNGWNAKISQSGTAVTAANESYNAALSTGGSVTASVSRASYSGTNAVPATFTLDGVTCNVDGGGGPTDPGGPTNPGDPGRPGHPGGQPVPVGAKGYVNPEWSAKAAARAGGGQWIRYRSTYSRPSFSREASKARRVES